MTIKEFTDHYYMHDSLINNIIFDKDHSTVIMNLDFAFWMQDTYVEGDPETGSLTLSFYGVTSYDCPEEIDFTKCSILDARYGNSTIILFMLNDFTDEDFEIRISAASVEVK